MEISAQLLMFTCTKKFRV